MPACVCDGPCPQGTGPGERSSTACAACVPCAVRTHWMQRGFRLVEQRQRSGGLPMSVAHCHNLSGGQVCAAESSWGHVRVIYWLFVRWSGQRRRALKDFWWTRHPHHLHSAPLHHSEMHLIKSRTKAKCQVQRGFLIFTARLMLLTAINGLLPDEYLDPAKFCWVL